MAMAIAMDMAIVRVLAMAIAIAKVMAIAMGMAIAKVMAMNTALPFATVHWPWAKGDDDPNGGWHASEHHIFRAARISHVSGML